MTPSAMTVFPVPAAAQLGPFCLFGELAASVGRAGLRPGPGDVLVVSTKYAAVSEGRAVRLSGVRPLPDARRAARENGMDPALAEVVLREADEVYGGVAGFVMASRGGMVAPNAGVDRSNAGGGAAVPYPSDPPLLAEQLRRRAFLEWGAPVGVILSDSRIAPTRAGTTGVAVACAGIDPVADRRGEEDIGGGRLVHTLQAVADSLATAANHAMGEAGESVPAALVRGSGARPAHRPPPSPAVPMDRCVYARGLPRRG